MSNYMQKKKIAICGASDCFLDPEYPGISWMEKFETLVQNNFEIENSSIEGASNFLILLQVEKSLKTCDIVIVNFTSSVRFEYCAKDQHSESELLDRFYRFYQSEKTFHDWSMICASALSVHKIPVLSTDQKQLIKDFYTHFHDMEIDIKKNSVFIKQTIETLITSGKKFIFSLGGFEHLSYLEHDSLVVKEFDKYQQYQSAVNLWDYIKDFRAPRPYFHITDTNDTEKIARNYSDFVNT